jgi:hypothetical protein
VIMIMIMIMIMILIMIVMMAIVMQALPLLIHTTCALVPQACRFQGQAMR